MVLFTNDRQITRLLVIGVVVSLLIMAIFIGKQAMGQERPSFTDEEVQQLLLERKALQPPPGYRRWTEKDANTEAVTASMGDRKMGRRPFDDYDPEMYALAEEFFSQPPCGKGPGGRCPEAKAPLQAGGEDLALYLIRHYELSIDEGYVDTATILTAIAGTESTAGTQYIEQLIDVPQGRQEFEFALSALKECASSRAVDKAIAVLDRAPEEDSQARMLAIKAIHQNIKDGNLTRPDAIRRLESVENRTEGMENRLTNKVLNSLKE